MGQEKKIRSPFYYYGGKGSMVKKLLPFIQKSKVYVEPYCGAASIFFAKEPSPIEVLNDLSGNIVNFFRCIQNKDTFAELKHRLQWTLYSRSEFVKAIDITYKNDDYAPNTPDIDRAWSLFTLINQGFSGKMVGITRGRWSRSFTLCGGVPNTAQSWWAHIDALDAIRDRLKYTYIDCADALDVIEYWDSDDTMFYIDPPYIHNTRTSSNDYFVEQVDVHHILLVKKLLSIKGKAVLSGYENGIYQRLLDNNWKIQRFDTVKNCAVSVRGRSLIGEGAKKKNSKSVECIWIKD